PFPLPRQPRYRHHERPLPLLLAVEAAVQGLQLRCHSLKHLRQRLIRDEPRARIILPRQPLEHPTPLSTPLPPRERYLLHRRTRFLEHSIERRPRALVCLLVADIDARDLLHRAPHNRISLLPPPDALPIAA